jgi:carboxypeptidase PM20D1
MRIGISTTVLTGIAILWLVSGATARAEEAPVAAAERLAEAIRFRTISWEEDAERLDREAFLGFHAFLERSFPRVHASLRREVVNQYSLLYTWPGEDPNRNPVLLTHHFDVVPVVEETLDQWQHPPFAGAIADGFVWGRGTMDDKSGAMALLEAAESLLAVNFAPKRTVYLAIGHDEEIGGDEGAGATAALLRKRGVRFEFTLDEGGAVVSDTVPGLEPPLALIGVAEKGSVTVRVTARADSGHSSMPPRTTAIGRLARAIQRIEESPMPARVSGPTALLLDSIGPQMGFPLRMLAGNRWLFGPILRAYLRRNPATDALIRTTTAVTMVEGGVKPNVLPDTATATVNFRLQPGDTADAVLAHVRQAIEDDELEIELLRAREASPVADAESASFQLLRASLAEVMPDVVVAPFLCVGGTDTKHYVNLAENSYRFSALRVRPDDAKRAHGVNERIALANYAEYIAFNEAVIRRAAGKPANDQSSSEPASP